MPQIRAEQVLSLTLKDLQIADDAAIQQHKIEDWESDASGWISKGIIKPVTTAELPIWDGSQAGQFYYDINTNEIFIGISTEPYYALIAGDGGATTGDTVLRDRIIIVKQAYEAENWSGTTDEDINGTASVFALDTDKVASDGSNLMVYLNGVLQERGSGNDYILYEEDEVDKIQFTYNLEGPDQKVSAIVSIDEYLVNYATKAFVESILVDSTTHSHNGSDSPRLDFNEAITSSSLSGIIHSIIPETNAVNLGSTTNPFGNVYANEGHFAANTIYLGNVALSGTDDTLLISKDNGATYYNVVISGAADVPAQLVAGTGQNTIISSDSNVNINGDNVAISGTTNITLTGSTVIDGDLYVQGTTTTVNSETLSTLDNIILLNSNTTDTPTEDAGLEIERGIETNYQIIFDETNDVFKVGEVGSLQVVATRENSPISTGVPFYNTVLNRFDTSDTTKLVNVTNIPSNKTGTLQAGKELQVDALHTNEYGADQLFISGANIDSNNTIYIGMGIAGGQNEVSTEFGGTVTAPAFSGPLTGNVTGTATSADKVREVNFHADSNEPSGTTRLNMDGYFYATRVYNATFDDLAEFFPKAEDAEPGMVMIQTADGVKPCEGRGDGAVVGVYSDSYGYALGSENEEDKIPVGLSGRVWVWVEEPCNIGDLLITSNKKGFGTVKKASEDGLGKIFAKVMKPKTDFVPERIEVFILNG